jgi:ketosteroid isomerase-like protein
MMQQGGTAESQIKAIIEAWADAVRRHDLFGILAHHEQDIVMFDVPPPLQSEWTSTRKHGICSSGITSRHKRST